MIEEEITKEKAMELLTEGHNISIDLGFRRYTITDYFITGRGTIQWIALLHNEFIPDYVVNHYYK